MYYSYKSIREVCDKNDNIENIVLVTAYYYFYSDLSLTKDLGELSRVSRVYYPLFNDLHNAILVPPCSSFFPISNILDIEKLIDKNFYDRLIVVKSEKEKEKEKMEQFKLEDLKKDYGMTFDKPQY